MNAETLQSLLRNKGVNYGLICLPETDSTNGAAKKLALSGGDWIVTADRQITGRGRLGRAFCSEPGGLYLSFVYRPDYKLSEAMHLTALCALAVSDAIESVCNISSDIKWPNDVLVSGKKICGILLEAVSTGDRCAVVTGIGVNVKNELPEELQSAGRLADFCRVPNEEALASEVICRTLGYFRRAIWDRESLLRRYAARCITIGRDIIAATPSGEIKGLASGIDENAALIIKTEDGRTEKVFFGEATLKKI